MKPLFSCFVLLISIGSTVLADNDIKVVAPENSRDRTDVFIPAHCIIPLYLNECNL